MFKNFVSAAASVTSKATEQALATAEIAKNSATEFSNQAIQSASNYLPPNESCFSCGKTVSTARNITGIGKLLICICCGNKFCKKCLQKNKIPVPDQLLFNNNTTSTTSTTTTTTPATTTTSSNSPSSTDKEKDKEKNKGIGYICKSNCLPKCVVQWMLDVTKKYEAITIDILQRQLQNMLPNLSLYQKPESMLDTKARKAKRLLYLAEYAAEVVGLDAYFQVLKFAAMGTGALSVILQGDTAKVLYPLMECLKQFGIEGPTGLIRVYYLGCNHQLARILDSSLESCGHNYGDPGVLNPICPNYELDYAGLYSGPAQWLYSALLPSPHDDEDWNKWYLSRIVSCQGWKLLFTMVQSSILPNGVSCPAFALVCRDDPNDKQALLVIRGTQTSIDWTINLEETQYSFVYRSGPKGEEPIQCSVHTGMMLGALHILDTYGMRTSLYSLIDNGYDVKIVGHSLGAGTSALLTAEFKNGLYSRAITQGSSARPLTNDLPRVCAVGYGCPPVVCETLADALLRDDLMLTVIHRDDIVPRLCRYNLENLAKEVNNIIPQADQWKFEDQASFQRYAATYGVVGDMSTNDETVNNSTQKESNVTNTNKLEVAEESSEIIEEEEELSISNELSEKITHQKPIQFVVPGKIIHLLAENGVYRAVLCNHRLEALRSITPLTHGIDDHKMFSHIKALRTIKFNQYRDGVSQLTISTPPPWQPFFDKSLNQWTKCSVCDSELIWPYITRSDATRAVVSHHCRACGKVACSLCAPKGDIIPIEGIGKYETLPDYSISIPSLGYIVPERVCLPCNLHSYNL